MFASHSLAEHILRGVIGIGALWAAIVIAPSYPLGSLGLAALALLAFRGCPMCWTIGLFDTVRLHWQRDQSS